MNHLPVGGGDAGGDDGEGGGVSEGVRGCGVGVAAGVNSPGEIGGPEATKNLLVRGGCDPDGCA